MNRLTNWLRRALPKPWLFGLYGALGGLFGALVFGEALWRALRPPAPVVGSIPPLRLAASPWLDVYQGGESRFGIKVAREGWSGPVTVTAVQVPPGVAIDPVIVPEDRGEMDLVVKAAAESPVGSSAVTVEAQGPPRTGPKSVMASLRLTIRKAQRPSPELRMNVSPEVVVEQRGANRIGVVIARDHFRGPVTVELGGLPDGVTAQPLTMPAEVTSGEIAIQAGAGSPVGSTALTVTATGPAGLPGAAAPPTASSRLSLRINARPDLPPGLSLSVSPGVVVDQRSKNGFGVIIARDHFRGPVRVELGDLPGGVTATSLTLPADATRGEIEVQAGAGAPVGMRVVAVTATGPDGLPGAPNPFRAFSRLNLTVNSTKSGPLKVDVMFVLDVTASMTWAIEGIRDGIIEFARELEQRKLDVRVGLTGFRDHLMVMPAKKPAPRPTRRRRAAAPNMPGMFGFVAPKPLDLAPQLLFIGGEVFTKDYRVFGEEVGANLVAIGGGDVSESSLDALAIAARQSFRQDASRVLILITDAGPHIPDLEVRSIEQEVGILRRAGIDQLHLVIRNEFRPAFAPLQAEASGSIFDLEEAARKKGAFAALLPEVSREIARIQIASQPPAPPPTESSPPPPPPAAVAVAPLDPPTSETPPPLPPVQAARDLPPVSPPPVLKGVQSQETFAVENSGRLLVAIAAWTAVITAMIALALCAGQYRYLRQGWLHPTAALSGWLGGLVAGLAGGVAGQLLYQVAPGTPAGELVFRVLGWALLGSLAGLVLAFFVPNLRSDRGMIGGAVGGAAGALAFLGATLAMPGAPGGDAGGRVLGAVLLGLALGLMLALAERIARKAWLKVCYGGGEFRTVNLGVEPVSIGSNTRAATIYARGAAPVAYRYWFLDGKIKREDVAAGTVTELRPDESHAIAAIVVTVRTAASATAPAPRPAPPPRPAPVAPPRPPAAAPVPPPAVRPAAPVATAASVPATPPAPSRPPAAPAATLVGAPALQPPRPAARQDSGACPGCGRPVPGVPGRRYCITCDLYS